ncbi:MAG: triose-phosphate isomerase [Syntrophomonadaceae bacterium]|nr:triose-phosphate isomerase [Syntrophomonadaceae bacterium]MDD3022806.1 triose-phosphate isomerase [Syntrophomonadaceae bacterium]
MRQILIAANWKMNKLASEALSFSRDFLPMAGDHTNIEVVICPPFTCLYTLQNCLNGTGIRLGGQNLFWEEKGAFTGEISPLMLADAGCTYVIIGHSERRQIMGESDVNINRKIGAALESGLIPILCVGETLQEREKNMAREIVKEQLRKGLQDISMANRQIVLAYEPVWAIGTGVNASNDDAQEMIAFIRSYMEKIYDKAIADSLRILYGGSVNEGNIADFIAKEDVDGALIGGASLQADSLAGIVRAVQNV